MHQKFTKEKFEEEFLKRGNKNVIILEEYRGYDEKILCTCKNHPHYQWLSSPRNLLKGRGCKECQREQASIRKSYSKEDFEKKLREKGRDGELKLIGDYIDSQTLTTFQCLINKEHIWESRPNSILKGCGCPFCKGKKVDKTNCLNTLRPDLVKYLKNKEDGEKVSLKSDKKIELKCPECGYEKRMGTKEFTRYGFTCPICDDGISFPNKFIRNMLIMLGIEFVPEWSPEWAGKKRYDVMFIYNNETILVEMDGVFHTIESKYNTLEKMQKLDKEKEELSIKNGCKLIRIDCIKSNAKIIFENILKSELSEILDLKDFNWQECGIRSSKSLLIEVCKYYNEHPDTVTKELSNIFKISTGAILRYLRKGKELGVCTVSVKEKISNRKKIKVIDITHNKEKIYKTRTELLQNFKKDFSHSISERTLVRILKGEAKNPWHNFLFVDLS